MLECRTLFLCCNFDLVVSQGIFHNDDLPQSAPSIFSLSLSLSLSDNISRFAAFYFRLQASFVIVM